MHDVAACQIFIVHDLPPRTNYHKLEVQWLPSRNRLSLLPTILPSMLFLSNDTEVFLLGDYLQEG